MPRLQRRTTGWLAAAITACAIFSTALTPLQAQAREFVSIKSSTANVRDKPSTKGTSILWELGKGYPLQVANRQGKWLRVKDHESTLGWVHSSLTHKTPHLLVTAPTANLRAGPGTQHRRVGRLEQNEIVRTLKKQGNWAQVKRDNGQQGWVSRKLAWGW
ncbi:SH3 domain-containing protein [Comamonas composti]|uniref:SH3 domain-containing protein n=1 Tax=Comamonas composti TaxID=408558 RepID=UPI00041A0978|nr:SH3 domain-containing protein [Comamonas composti]